jgi:hypothetical protein
LDPDYINAWKKLGELSGKIEMTSDERNRIAFALFRLSHEAYALSKVTDLPRAWSEILQAEVNLPVALSGPVYPLAAAAAAQEVNASPRRQRFYYPRMYYSGRMKPVRTGFLNNDIVEQAKSTMERLLSRD